MDFFKIQPGKRCFLIYMTMYFFLCMHNACGASENTAPHTQPLKDSLLNAASGFLNKVGEEWGKAEKKIGTQLEKVIEKSQTAFTKKKEETSPDASSDHIPTPSLPWNQTHSNKEERVVESIFYDMDQLDASPIVERASPAIVNIHVKYNRLYTHPFFSDPFFRAFFGDNIQNQSIQEQAIGSGTIVRKDGIILTCAHVIEGGDDIIVQLHDGRRFGAKVIFSNKNEDIAFLKIDTSKEDLALHNPPQTSGTLIPTEFPTLPLAEKDEPKVGRFVLAMGYPQGQKLVTFGMISSMGEVSLSGGELRQDHVITVTAEMGPGMSGGALLNLKGECIGIPNAILVRHAQLTKHGIAIPIGVALKYLRTMDKDGTIKQPWHGMDVKPILTSMYPHTKDQPFLKNAHNSTRNAALVVTDVSKGGPLDKAGLKTGDIIQQINGKTPKNFRDFKATLSTMGVGDAIILHVKRDNTPITLHYTVGEIIETDKDQTIILQSGFLQGINVRFSHKGAEISTIPPQSPARSFGLEVGDILLSLNQHPIETVKDLEDFNTSHFALEIQRGHETLSMRINMDPPTSLRKRSFF